MSNAVIQLLEGTLNGDQASLAQSEAELESLCMTHEGLDGLIQILLGQENAPHHRQGAAFVLKKFIRHHWSQYETAFQPPEIPRETREFLRERLFMGLWTENRLVRNAIANLVAIIAEIDFPLTRWDSLPQDLLQAVNGTLESIDSGMKVLNDFVSETITDDAVIPFAQLLVPRLQEIVGYHEFYLRARAILVFRQCVFTLGALNDSVPGLEENSFAVLTQWMHVLLGIAQEASTGSLAEQLVLQHAVYRTFLVLAENFPKAIAPFSKELLSVSLFFLKQVIAEPFQQTYINDELSEYDLPDLDPDLSTSVDAVACTVVDFLGTMYRFKSFRRIASAKDLENAAVFFVQMSKENEDSWQSDASEFVAAEEDSTRAIVTPRQTALDFISSIVEIDEQVAVPALIEIWQSCAGSSDWRTIEACLACIGASSSEFVSWVSQHNVSIAEHFVSQLVSLCGSTGDLPLLQGRGFLLLGQLCGLIPAAHGNEYFKSIVGVLNDASFSFVSRVSAVRAVRAFAAEPKIEIDPESAMPALATVASFLEHLTSEGDSTLFLTFLSAIESLFTIVSEHVDAEAAYFLIKRIALSVFAYSTDPLATSSAHEVLGNICSQAPAASVQQALSLFLPELSHIIVAPMEQPFFVYMITQTFKATASWDTQAHSRHVCALAIQRLCVETADSIFDAIARRTDSLGPLFQYIATALLDLADESDDPDTVQNILTTATSAVRAPDSQFNVMTDAKQVSVVERLLRIISKVVSMQSEAGSLFLGDLVLQLLQHTSLADNPILVDMLAAFLARLQKTQTNTLRQSLVLPFAYLGYLDAPTLMRVISGIPIEKPLAILFGNWMEIADSYYAASAQISNMALGAILRNSAGALQGMTVAGGPVADEEIVVTRSMAKAMKASAPEIPLSAKIIKVLLSAEHQAAEQDDEVVSQFSDDDNVEEVDDNDNEADELSVPKNILAFSEQFNEKDEDDYDTLLPQFKVDLKKYLDDTFAYLNRNDPSLLANAVAYLTKHEKQILDEVLQVYS